MLCPLFGLLVGKGIRKTIAENDGTTGYKRLDVVMAQVKELIQAANKGVVTVNSPNLAVYS